MEPLTMDEVTDFEHLYTSMLKCRCGVGWKDSTLAFCLNGPEQVVKLERELKSGTYQPRPPRAFTITNPKRREIVSISFRDRVYQRSLNDNALYPIMTRSFIYDNWACQKGKGTLRAKERLYEFLRSYYRKHGTDGWVAQFDIKGYYPNMRHDAAEACFRKKLPDDVHQAVVNVLRSQYGGEIGYNPGSQMIQIAGISLLDDMDHYIKEQLHARYYLRYMDDFMIISSDREYLERCVSEVERILNSLGFELNMKKTRIYPLKDGIMFLGFRFRLTETGRVLKLVDPRNVKANRKKYARLVAKCKRGEMQREDVDKSWQCWMNHLEYGDTYNLRRRLNQYYKSLWRDVDVGNQNQEKEVPGER